MAKHRQEKVSHELLRVLATALLQDVKDPRLAAVTLTDVHVSADLQIAHINWLCDKNLSREEITTGLEKATPFLRSLVGERLALRRGSSAEAATVRAKAQKKKTKKNAKKKAAARRKKPADEAAAK